MKKIKVHSLIIQQIAKELDVTTQTVRMSLHGLFNSDKSKAIRYRAKELIHESADEIQIEIKKK